VLAIDGEKALGLHVMQEGMATTEAHATERLGLMGLFGIGNFGNDGSLESMVSFLRRTRPQAELVCICPEPERVKRNYGINTAPFLTDPLAIGRMTLANRALFGIPRRLGIFARILHEVRQLDALIIPGAGTLDDFGASARGWPLGLFAWCVAARIVRTKILFVSVGAGPMTNRLARWLMKSAASLATYRSYRDTVSRDFMSGIGLNSQNDPVYPDIAFQLPHPSGCTKGRRSDITTVGLGVMTYHGWRHRGEKAPEIYDAYMQKLICFAEWLLDTGYHIRILAGDTYDERAIEDLSKALKESRPPLSSRVTAVRSANIHDVMQQLCQVDIVVATRFHNVICSLMVGKPAISIGYSAKNDAIMSAMGLEAYCQHIEDLDVDLLVRQLQALLHRRGEHERNISRVNSLYRLHLAQQEATLLQKLA
jgi:polysaccharide pyruvyl transferase WcaK-like protein